jgi:ribose transport system ATP-binding protein
MKMTMGAESGGRVSRLQIVDVSKAFAGQHVLRNVSCSADQGEIVALLGANGAGKSTLMKILSGVYTTDSGTIRVDGVDVDIRSPQDAIAAGIRLMPQELSIHPDLSVAENIALGGMPTRRIAGIGVVDIDRMERQALDLLQRLRLDHVSPRQRMGSLPLPEQRLVEIARALAGQARILILDEPTASLGQADAENLFSVLDALRQEGVTILYISHYLNEVFRLSNRIVVLRDGEIRGRFRTNDTSREEVLAAMLGSGLGDLYPPRVSRRPGAQTVISVDGLTLPGRLEGGSFSVKAGEIVGVFGLLGSGADLVGRAIYGAEPSAGVRSLRLMGEEVALGNIRSSVGRGIGFVAAERKRQGLIANLSVRANTTLAYLGLFSNAGWSLDRQRETFETEHWIRSLRIKTSGPDQEIRLLSGGNQQKVCLARWLLGKPHLLILEEPTRGVDLGARREIYALIRRLADDGLAILIVSSDAEEVAGMADRTLVFNEGALVGELDDTASAATLMRAAENFLTSMNLSDLETA